MANKALIIDSADMTLEQKVMALIACVAQEKKAQTDKVLSGVGLSLLQLNLLHQLDYASSGGMTVNQLKSAMVDDNPNVSRTLNKMVETGLVTKKRDDEDQRTVHIRITPKGKKAHTQGDAQLVSITTGLNKGDLATCYALLQKM